MRSYASSQLHFGLCGHVGYRAKSPLLGSSQLVGIDAGSALQLLFVCTGNICRSPTAERLAMAYSARFKISNVVVASAGTRAVVGHPIHTNAIDVLERLGGDATDFSARQLTARIAASADLIVTMTRAHRDSVLELAPRKLHRTFMLGEVAQLVSRFDPDTVADLGSLRSQLGAVDVPDVPDPIGLDPDAFEMAGALISHLIPPVMNVCARGVFPLNDSNQF